jgi:PilZ domain-containing protein
MAIIDRRSGVERRVVHRNKVALDIEWEDAAGGRHPGTLGDISEIGCFVLSSGEFTEGDTLKLFLPVGDGMKVQVLGEIKNAVLEIGFALRFVNLTDAQRLLIRQLIETHGKAA